LRQLNRVAGLVIAHSGGNGGLRDLNALESALAQPMMTFDGADLYPTLDTKAGAISYSLIQNHSFIDGNKRIGHATMEVLLVINGLEIDASIDEQETLFVGVASGELSRAALTEWIEEHLAALS
jgi:death on curing protein